MGEIVVPAEALEMGAKDAVIILSADMASGLLKG